jgi:hypothetical protein
VVERMDSAGIRGNLSRSSGSMTCRGTTGRRKVGDAGKGLGAVEVRMEGFA